MLHLLYRTTQYREFPKTTFQSSGACLGSLWIALLLGWLLPTGSLTAQDTETLPAPIASQDLEAEYRSGLEELARQCETLQRPDLAEATRRQILPNDPSRQFLYLPSGDTGVEIPSDAEDSTAMFWAKRLQALRGQFAEKLFQAARAGMRNNATEYQATAVGQLYRASMLAPDHPELNRILERQRQGQFFVLKDLLRCSVRRSRRPDRQLSWQAGEYHEVNTANFHIVSTATPEQARAMAARMEIWRFLWRQWAAAYWLPAQELRVCLEAGRPLPSGGERRHEIVLFATRQQFLTTLGQIKGIERSVGYYDGQLQRSFFYLDDEDDDLSETWQHELNHQLFSETGRRVQKPGESTNTWLAEGIAIYFESLKPVPEQEGSIPWESVFGANSTTPLPSHWSIGGFEARRIQFARIRYFREGFFVSFSDLVQRGRIEFQQDPELRKTYSQIGAMCHFLLHANEGAYSKGMWELLTLLYAGRDRADSLETITGSNCEELQSQYQKWLPFTPSQNPHWSFATANRELALGNGPLNTLQLQNLQAPGLYLLQLSETEIDDAIQPWLSRQVRMQQLYLDKTALSDKALVAALPQMLILEELDLAGTQITDETLAHLPQNGTLKRIWLTGTQITDQCVEDLLKQPALEMVDLRGTNVSDEAVQRLRQKIKRVDR